MVEVARNESSRSRGQRLQSSLVPRTRRSPHNCREPDCELWVQSGTGIIELLTRALINMQTEGPLSEANRTTPAVSDF
jgi:hypothetical protein